MPKVTHSTGEVHPEGWFKFVVLSSELAESEYKGKKNIRMKFMVKSTERKEDGSPFELSVWTGTVVSDHPNCKLKHLIEACGMECEGFEDTDELTDCIFAGKVELNKETGYANITAYDTKDRVRPKRTGNERAPKRDPFEEE